MCSLNGYLRNFQHFMSFATTAASQRLIRSRQNIENLVFDGVNFAENWALWSEAERRVTPRFMMVIGKVSFEQRTPFGTKRARHICSVVVEAHFGYWVLPMNTLNRSK
ncbi:hypothetical protein CBL_05445 [Carabus blaptoides fortunei]